MAQTPIRVIEPAEIFVKIAMAKDTSLYVVPIVLETVRWNVHIVTAPETRIAHGVMVTAEKIVSPVVAEVMMSAFRVMEEVLKNVLHVMVMVRIPMGTGVLGVGAMGIKDVLVALVMVAQNVSLAMVEVTKIAHGVGEGVIKIVPNVMVLDLWSVKPATVMGK